MRTCVGCRKRSPREALVRVVCSPEGVVLVDRYLKAPGRGAHICYDPRCVGVAVERRAFGRAFRRQVSPVDVEALVASIVEATEARVLDGLRIGRSAGWTESGADVLERSHARLRLLIVAQDAADGTVARLLRLAEKAECRVRHFGDREGLGATQRRDMLAAVGVVDEGLAARLESEFERRDRLGLLA